jgi:hypothetical protein
MSKGNKQRGNREAKKPKQEKPKAAATAGFLNAAKSPVLGSKKDKQT